MDSQSTSRYPIVTAAAVLGALLLLSALAFGAFFYRARAPERTVAVTGSATQAFEADVVKWRFTVSRAASEQGLREGFAALRDDVAALRASVRAKGLPDSAFVAQPPVAQPQYGPNGRSGYTLQQPVYLISERLGDVEGLALDPSALLRDGAALEASQLEYFYSGIARIKHDLLAKATADARVRADQIARSTGAEAGRIQSARSGVFQITEPYSTEVSSGGMFNTSTRKKEITVTVHATFRLD